MKTFKQALLLLVSSLLDAYRELGPRGQKVGLKQ
jgi:hypothetical protein